jgi:pyruvate formate lyase activating enzyme
MEVTKVKSIAQKKDNNIKKTAVLFNIQRFSLHDGPGIRTIIFFKGCPLNCLWCSNPEAQNSFPELTYNQRKCIGCKKCINVCPVDALSFTDEKIKIDRNRCDNCGKCLEVCISEALVMIGKEWSIEEIIDEIEKDRIFYFYSDGGVTLSGGDPFFQSNFLKPLIKKIKELNMSVAIETCGHVKENIFKDISGLADLILFDLKILQKEKHLKYTGKSNDLILSNLKQLSKGKGKLRIRYTVIPGINDSEKDILNLIRVLKENRIKEIELMPYHNLGVNKYKLLQRGYSFPELKAPRPEDLFQLKESFRKHKIACKVY